VGETTKMPFTLYYKSSTVTRRTSTSNCAFLKFLLLPSREWLFFFLRENGPSPLRGFISTLPLFLQRPLHCWLRPLHCWLRPLLRRLLFISLLLQRLVLPSRLVNLLPSVVLVLSCCIVLCFDLHYCCLFCVLCIVRRLVLWFSVCSMLILWKDHTDWLHTANPYDFFKKTIFLNEIAIRYDFFFKKKIFYF